MNEKILNSGTKFQKLKQERIERFCRDYITFSPEIKANQTSAWQIICGISEKYEVTPNTVLTALRKKNLYCGRSNPLNQGGVDEFLNSLFKFRKLKIS